MKRIGFVKSNKENEKRRALLPEQIIDFLFKEYLYFEKNYGEVLCISDNEYKKIGCHIVTREEALSMDVICDPKVGDADYLTELKKGQVIFGWVHAVQNRSITDLIINNRLTAFAWEDMFESGRHVFWRNNEIAGEAAVTHALLCHGTAPFGLKVAIIGRGNIARGAYKILSALGAEVTVYDRKTEELFQRELHYYDIIINAILWDTKRKDHIIYSKDLLRMKKGAMIIDISCDRNGGIESSEPTTIENPIFYDNNIAHYVVDHTPSLFYKTASREISKILPPYIEQLITYKIGDILKISKIIDNGLIIDKKIIEHQSRKMLKGKFE